MNRCSIWRFSILVLFWKLQFNYFIVNWIQMKLDKCLFTLFLNWSSEYSKVLGKQTSCQSLRLIIWILFLWCNGNFTKNVWLVVGFANQLFCVFWSSSIFLLNWQVQKYSQKLYYFACWTTFLRSYLSLCSLAILKLYAINLIDCK